MQLKAVLIVSMHFFNPSIVEATETKTKGTESSLF